MKKLFAVLMTLVLVLSMGTIAFAADDAANATTGTITIKNAIPGETYYIFKMLDFEPVEGSTDKGVYRVTDKWADFFTRDILTNDYFDFETDDTGYALPGSIIKIKDGMTIEQELVDLAMAYATNKLFGGSTNSIVAENETVVFEDVELGYYYIRTTVGTMGALTNTNNKLKALEKNVKPDIDKFVQEDSEINNSDGGWGKVNDAEIGQVVNFKSTVTVGKGAETFKREYIMHDKMETGLTFNNDVRVELDDGTLVDASNYEVITDTTDGDTFDVVFKDSFIKTIEAGKTFTVYYSAILNEEANIVDDGNDNTVKLTYFVGNYIVPGVGPQDKYGTTQEHKTTTYTWKMDVFKYTDVDTPLAGAKFQLLYGGKAVELVVDSTAEDGTVIYRVATAEDKDNADVEVIDTIETTESGLFDIIGLDEGSYVLRETEAPEGYNLAADIPVVIDSTYYEDDEANLSATYTINDADPVTIEVENKTGGLLPETGGIGTTIFYIVGGLLMVAAVVFLVTKKRMAAFA